MILAIDIGNTNIVVGCIDREKIYFVERLSTVRTKTELEYAIDLKTVLDIYHIKGQEIEGCIISSVVPQITNVARLAAEKILKKDVMVVGPGLKTGLNIMLDNPSEMGADRVADAVAAGDRGYGNSHNCFRGRRKETVYGRHDPSGSKGFAGRSYGKGIPVKRHQYRRA